MPRHTYIDSRGNRLFKVRVTYRINANDLALVVAAMRNGMEPTRSVHNRVEVLGAIRNCLRDAGDFWHEWVRDTYGVSKDERKAARLHVLNLFPELDNN